MTPAKLCETDCNPCDEIGSERCDGQIIGSYQCVCKEGFGGDDCGEQIVSDFMVMSVLIGKIVAVVVTGVGGIVLGVKAGGNLKKAEKKKLNQKGQLKSGQKVDNSKEGKSANLYTPGGTQKLNNATRKKRRKRK